MLQAPCVHVCLQSSVKYIPHELLRFQMRCVPSWIELRRGSLIEVIERFDYARLEENADDPERVREVEPSFRIHH